MFPAPLGIFLCFGCNPTATSKKAFKIMFPAPLSISFSFSMQFHPLSKEAFKIMFPAPLGKFSSFLVQLRCRTFKKTIQNNVSSSARQVFFISGGIQGLPSKKTFKIMFPAPLGIFFFILGAIPSPTVIKKHSK